MNEIIFITYIISLVAFATALYALLELNELKKYFKSKQKTKSTTVNEIKRPKGHWD